MSGESSDINVPLCVDLDGTLIKSDMLFESLCRLFRANPLYALCAFFWLLKGRAYLKQKVAARVRVEPALLPYNLDFLEWLKQEKARGRKLVLASASDKALVQNIADHVGIFEEVLASDGKTNLRGANKLKTLEAHYGVASFDYAGNSSVDYPVWKGSREAVVVSHGARFLKNIPSGIKIGKSFVWGKDFFKVFINAIRVHQWVKNLLVFVPLVMAHRAGSVEVLGSAIIAFFAFSLCASSVYVTNDLLDLDSDRQHRSKKNRAFASGELAISFGLIIAPLFLIIAFVLAGFLSVSFVLTLSIYFLLTLAYSLYLKQQVILDIVILASLYTIRILAGGFAAGVPVSQWLLGFSMFFFLSLACMKRYSELYGLREMKLEKTQGRGYLASDLEQVSQFGSASGYISILVLALYVSSEEVTRLYNHREVLWLLSPLLLYWVSRVWLLAHRGEIHDDPIVFAITDRVSYFIGAISLLIMYFAI